MSEMQKALELFKTQAQVFEIQAKTIQDLKAAGFPVASLEKPIEKCKQFAEYGKCKWGDACKFSHEVNADFSTPQPKPKAKENMNKRLMCTGGCGQEASKYCDYSACKNCCYDAGETCWGHGFFTDSAPPGPPGPPGPSGPAGASDNGSKLVCKCGNLAAKRCVHLACKKCCKVVCEETGSRCLQHYPVMDEAARAGDVPPRNGSPGRSRSPLDRRRPAFDHGDDGH